MNLQKFREILNKNNFECSIEDSLFCLEHNIGWIKNLNLYHKPSGCYPVTASFNEKEGLKETIKYLCSFSEKEARSRFYNDTEFIKDFLKLQKQLKGCY